MDAEIIVPLVVCAVICFAAISFGIGYYAYHEWKIRKGIKSAEALNEALESEKRRIEADSKEITLDLKKQLDSTLEKLENDYQSAAFDLFHRVEIGERTSIASIVTIINHLSEPDVITAFICYGSPIVSALYGIAKDKLDFLWSLGEDYPELFKRYTDALEYGVHVLPELYEVLHRQELISDYEKDGCTKAEAIQLAEQKIHNEKILKQGEQNIMLQKKQIEMMEEQNTALANNFGKLRDDVCGGLRDISAEQSRTSSTVAMLGLLQNGRM